MTTIEVPDMINLPEKLMPLIKDFNKYRYFLIEGGRGSGKTQGVTRFMSYIAETNQVRIVCGRETQNSIEESVYTAFADIIRDYDLNYRVLSSRIDHNTSGSTIRFKGFREQGSINIKGLEGVDILWIDEAQAISKTSLDVLIPTIRKENSKMIFTMNRFMRDDAVYEFCAGRDDCLHIVCNYYDNNYCPDTLKIEAQVCKERSEKDYRHIWLGQPLTTASDYLFNYDKILEATKLQPFGTLFEKQRVMGIDFAAQGDDLCVATILDRKSGQHWEIEDVIGWDEPDTTISIGKIVNLIGQFKPDAVMLDIGGMGKPVYDRLKELGIDIHPFDGATTEGVDKKTYGNKRAQAYYRLKEWFEDGFLCMSPEYTEMKKELEKIRFKYHSNGRRYIWSKIDLKKELGYSPDFADSLMMAVDATRLLGKANINANAQDHAQRITRKGGRRNSTHEAMRGGNSTIRRTGGRRR